MYAEIRKIQKLPLKEHSSNFNTSYRLSKKLRDKLEKQHAL